MMLKWSFTKKPQARENHIIMKRFYISMYGEPHQMNEDEKAALEYQKEYKKAME